MSDRIETLKPDALAETYARPLFRLADQAGDPDSVLEQLDELLELLEEHPELRQLFEHQGIDPERIGGTIQRLFEGRADDLVVRFLLVLNEHRRLGHLRMIRAAYDQMLKASRNQVDVAVYTARPLDDQQREQVAQRLSDSLGREAILHEETDERLIGGLRIRYEDKLIDASVASQLRRLGHQMNMHGHEAVRGALDRVLSENGDGRVEGAGPRAEAGGSRAEGVDT